MEMRDHHDVGRFVREHQVHYEVEPEEAVEGERHELVGVQVRLFAMHERSKLGLPGCEACVELAGELRSFAEQILRTADATDRTEIVATAPALYQSPEVPEADEVALTMRVRCDSPESRAPRAGVDRCLGDIRDRLGEAGVARR